VWLLFKKSYIFRKHNKYDGVSIYCKILENDILKVVVI